MSREVNHTIDWTVSTFDSVLPKLAYPEGMLLAREQGLVLPGQWEKLDEKTIKQILGQIGYLTDLRGFVYLEVGAGQNDIAATLRERGAKVKVVDPEYATPQRLDQRVSSWVASHDSSIAQGVLDDLSKGRQRFKADFQRHRGDYIASFSTDLSRIPDNSVDLGLSHFCISPVVSPHPGELIRSLEELIRKLKPGQGVAKIYPFDNLEDLYFGNNEVARMHAASLDQGRRFLDQVVPNNWQEYMWPEQLPYPLNKRKFLVIRRPAA